MNISSLNSSLANLYTQYYTNNSVSTNTNLSDTSLSGTSGQELQDVLGISLDGDTFSRSSSLGSLTTYSSSGDRPAGPPPDGAVAPNSDIKDFLDKVKDGTVTQNDLTKMQTELQEMDQSQNTGSTQSTSSVNSTQNNSTDFIKSFLDKVKSGTVTQDDLTNMQTELSQDQPAGSPPGGAGAPNSGIKDFLDKVKAGTVTQDDLTKIEAELQQMDQNQESGSTQSTSSVSSTQNNSTDFIKSFLDKVKSGTLTQDDLQSMEAQLQQIQM